MTWRTCTDRIRAADVPRLGFSCWSVQRARMCSGANFILALAPRVAPRRRVWLRFRARAAGVKYHVAAAYAWKIAAAGGFVTVRRDALRPRVASGLVFAELLARPS